VSKLLSNMLMQVHAAQQTQPSADVGVGDPHLLELFKTSSPVLCNIRFSINISI
jgi:hypothetical protein